jgi:hypothetical protein
MTMVMEWCQILQLLCFERECAVGPAMLLMTAGIVQLPTVHCTRVFTPGSVLAGSAMCQPRVSVQQHAGLFNC